ncbi:MULTISPECIES: hypothetical protein [unclassified Archaeoglobus]|jgi:hypothetical protein|uniref:hypothetical protein n=1 Tax=unclassified Archaeoglobus TaxID=2643606 RepID=UPI0025C51C69|nr:MULTISPECIES: hypothetical protein [unclassified Archaeoglobus]
MYSALIIYHIYHGQTNIVEYVAVIDPESEAIACQLNIIECADNEAEYHSGVSSSLFS